MEYRSEFSAAADSMQSTLYGFGAGGRDTEKSPIRYAEVVDELRHICSIYNLDERDAEWILHHFAPID